MYYGRKKGIIIAIIVIAILLVVGVGGTCLYMFTDLFKSNEKLFWKYAGREIDNMEVSSNLQMEEIQKKKEQMPYITNGKITLSSTDEEINTMLEGVNLSFEGKVDKTNEYSYLESKIKRNNQEIFDLKYVQDGELYALKSDEIVNAFLAVRNENLNVLMQKLGISGITIPDKIEKPEKTNLSKITDEDIKHIKETYSNVIAQTITKDCYSRQTEAVIEKDGVSYTTIAYRLDLSANLISNIALNILNTLKNDSVTLNLLATKADELGLNEEYTTVDGINSVIDDMIDNLENVNFIDTSFIVYAYKGDTIVSEIIIKNKSKLTLYLDSSIKLKYENFEEDASFDVMNIEMSIKNTTTQSSMYINTNVDDEIEIGLNIESNGSATSGMLDTNITATVTIEDTTTEIKYVGTTEFINELENVEKLTSTNCAVLNDYSQQDLNVLIQALTNQIQNVLTNKLQTILGSSINMFDKGINSNVVTNASKEVINSYNNKILPYLEKEISCLDTKNLLNLIIEAQNNGYVVGIEVSSVAPIYNKKEQIEVIRDSLIEENNFIPKATYGENGIIEKIFIEEVVDYYGDEI